MEGDFAHLSATTVAQWPHRSDLPITRGWLPPVSITLTAAATGIFGARLWSIRRSSYGFALDDAFSCAAWIFAVLLTSACVAGSLRFGFDRHMWDVKTDLYNSAALVEWLSEVAFLISTCLTRTSVLCFYRRIDPPCPKVFRRIIYASIALTVASTLAFILAHVFLCRPTASYWRILETLTAAQHQRFCASQRVIYPLQGAMSSFSTAYTIMIPVSVLRNIPMVKTQRYGLRAVTLLSLLVLGADIARTFFLSRLVDSPNGDATWNGFNVLVCSQLECQISLICASLPFLQRYLSDYSNGAIISTYQGNKIRNDSVMSRVSSSLSGQIKRSFPFRKSDNPHQIDISAPQAIEIPEWEFQSLESPRSRVLHTAVDGDTYERYLAGLYGPAPPPKDSRELFQEYRRVHGA